MNEELSLPELAAAIQPRILFKPGSWLANIDLINHLILFNNVIINVLSEKGGGKTSFTSLLQNNLDQQIKSVFIPLSANCNHSDLIRDIAAQFNDHFDERTDLATVVTQINELKAHVVLLIDNAQYLPESFMEEAIAAVKQQETFGFFHLCLLSDQIIATPSNKLGSPFSDNVIHTIELGSLNEIEARTYVLQRAMTANLINKPFTDTQFKQFYELTKGHLAKINSELQPFILHCAEQKRQDPSSLVKKISFALGVVLIAGFAGFYLSQSFDLYSTEQLETVTLPVPNKNDRAQENSTAALNSQIASWRDSSTQQLVYSSLPKKETLDDLDEEFSVEHRALVDKVIVLPKVQVHKNPSTEPKKIAQPKLAKQPQKTVHKKSVIARRATPKPFTIQVVASHKKQVIVNLKQMHKALGNNAKIRHFTNAQGNWYVLTVGEYESRAQAQRTIPKLPIPLRRLNPWIRSTSNIG